MINENTPLPPVDIQEFSPEQCGWVRRKDMEEKFSGDVKVYELPDGTFKALQEGYTRVLKMRGLV